MHNFPPQLLKNPHIEMFLSRNLVSADVEDARSAQVLHTSKKSVKVCSRISAHSGTSKFLKALKENKELGADNSLIALISSSLISIPTLLWYTLWILTMLPPSPDGKNKSCFVQKVALQFIDGGIRQRYTPSIKVREAGFGIDLNDVAAIVQKRDNKTLSTFKVEGIAGNLFVLFEKGVETSELPKREEIYGNGHFIGKLPKCFWVFVWEALQELTLIILFVCAIIFIGLCISVEGWPSGMYNGLEIIHCLFLVIAITAVSDYNQYMQFKDLDREKKNIFVKVTRDGYSQTVPKTDLVVRDVVHLFTRDNIPVDGIYIYGSMLLIDESSLTGESVPVHVNRHNPFLLSGTTMQDGKDVMWVTIVGMNGED
ncbi:hypothetical protein GIB67_038929 [Kingdonia uniflora]|uniref:Cation-transporting P-type ATPase N-terminal domain-containing protein n=1 Tax=Kingdonia uniflora TaxID=39325 RepID=A0A7J7LQK0_9MAGN|nr:hypothetical protein GIB67_038929 [Kingdonia uniflora]